MSSESLLALHAHDTKIEQLTHRRLTLPERALLDDLSKERGKIDAESADLDTQRDALARDQRRLEDEVASLEAKTEEEQGKLYGGSLTSPKEAQALQDEIASLKRHQTSLEDRIIDLMEQIEPLTGSIEAFDAARAGIDEKHDDAQSRLQADEADIDAELAVVEGERTIAAEAIDADLMSRYDAVRTGFGPSGVVEFDGKNCVGCPLAMPAVELDRMKKAEPGTVIECQECGRLVAR
ncbi:MAG: zinc ribbon domain-containing protein [Acidimicrobiales bacterium]